ncbi:hypothetical protein C8R44DRAFT_91533 [Mycena epipterygia]|nr:hypothetical protein C8R44DRAFT_91533 [Mycena epipterygia]
MSIRPAFTGLSLAFLPATAVAQLATSLAVPTSTTTHPSVLKHLSPGARAGVAVGIVIGVCLIVVASYFCCCHAVCTARRERKHGKCCGKGRHRTARLEDGVTEHPDTEIHAHDARGSTYKGDDNRRAIGTNMDDDTRSVTARSDDGARSTKSDEDDMHSMAPRPDDDVRSTGTAPPTYEQSW